MLLFYNSGLGAGKATRIRRTRRWRRNRSCKNDWGRQGRGIHVQRPSIRTYMRPPLGGHNSIDKCYTNAKKICWERGTWWQYNRIIMWFFPTRWKTYTSNTLKYWISETHAQCVHMLTEWHYNVTIANSWCWETVPVHQVHGEFSYVYLEFHLPARPIILSKNVYRTCLSNMFVDNTYRKCLWNTLTEHVSLKCLSNMCVQHVWRTYFYKMFVGHVCRVCSNHFRFHVSRCFVSIRCSRRFCGRRWGEKTGSWHSISAAVLTPT